MLWYRAQQAKAAEAFRRADRKRREACYRFVLNELGYVCRDWFTRSQLEGLIDGGFTPDDLSALFGIKLKKSKGSSSVSS